MSEPSSYNTFESEEESSGWLMSSESAIDEDEDDLSDELTLLNGDENSDDDSLLDDEFIRLSQRLKEKYKLQEATVGLERCDKIWDTMQLLKKIQRDYDSENTLSDDDEDDDDYRPSRSISGLAEASSSSVPYIKYQPVQGNGNNALPNFYLAVKSQRKVYHCVTCGRQYSERRSLRLHSQKEHGIVLPPERHKSRSTVETRTLRPRTPSELVQRGVSATDEKVAHASKQLRRRADEAKDSPLVTKRPDSTELNQLLGIALECPLCPATFTTEKRLYRHSIDFHAMSTSEARKKRRLKSRKSSKIGRKAASSSESLSESSKSSDSKPERRLCDKNPTKDQTVRNRQIRTIDGVKYRYLYTCKSCEKTFVLRKSLRVHTARHHGLHLPSYKRGGFLAATKNNEIFKAELIKVEDEAMISRCGKSHRGGNSKFAGKRKGIERPRRACALRTSYTECTKREEEVLQKTLAGIPGSPPKTPPATSDCFLCKRPYVDVRKHLVDYHRINSPESVLPLAKAEEAPAETAPEPTEAIEAGDDPRVALLRGSKGRKIYQCALCLYKYKNLSTIVKHLRVNTVNGVLQEHEIYARKRRNSSREKDSDPLADPLALTDCSEGSKNNSNGNATSEDDDSESLSRKRTTSSSDERLTPSLEAKRRKIEEAIERAEEESVVALSESDCRSVEGAKSGQREARDSSDRDSGIGISITIKKRNDSYEVVERDEARTKATPSTRDDDLALSCDSSTDVANGDFCRENQDRGCEIVDSIDCSKDEGVPGTMSNDEGRDAESESERRRSSEADFGFHGTERHGDEGREITGGNVPSLIVLSRTALNRCVSSLTMRKNDHFTITHKCPLCCRSYATERDVTIHMLEHKVSRSDFRTARLHVIPSSALRRYGRSPV